MKISNLNNLLKYPVSDIKIICNCLGYKSNVKTFISILGLFHASKKMCV